MIGLTPRQRKTLSFLRQYIGQHGYSPTVREIQAGLKLSSKSQVWSRLEQLQQRGYIVRDYCKARSIELVEQPVFIDGQRFRFIPKTRASSPLSAGPVPVVTPLAGAGTIQRVA